MGRIFAIVTLICLTALVVIGLTSPNDAIFLFAAQGPLATAVRVLLAAAMLALALSPSLKSEKARGYVGLLGFSMITVSVFVLGATHGSGIYPFFQPADLLTSIIVGITLSISALETAPEPQPVASDRYFFYQEPTEESARPKSIKVKPA